MVRLYSCVLVLASLVLAAVAGAAPTARFTASPIQGSVCVAPCAVHFDAIGTGNDRTVDPAYSRPFHTLSFEWEFGDASSGVWAVSGRSRNQAFGAIAGHVYEQPGTYTVTLRVTNPRGERSTASSSVTVVNPTNHFATASTWCFANSGTPGGAGFEACPVRAAAQHVVISSSAAGGFQTGLERCGVRTHKSRCLFRTGDTFRSSGMSQLSGPAGPGLLASFGAGPMPRVTGGNGFTAPGDGWTVAGFDVELTGTTSLFRLDAQRSNVTALRVRGRNLGSACFTSATADAERHSNLIAVIQLDCLNQPTSDVAGLFLRTERTLVMGNVIDSNYSGEFNMRTVHFPRSVVQHNRMVRPQEDANNRRNNLQIRSWAGTTGPNDPTWRPPVPTATEWVIVSDNFMSNDNAGLHVRTCQTNNCNDALSAQNLQNVIFERNMLAVSSGGSGGRAQMARSFWIQGGDITIRNNVLDMQGEQTNAVGSGGLALIGASMSLAPTLNDDRVQVLNNTVYGDDPTTTGFTFCKGSPSSTGHLCYNNLAYLPNRSGSLQLADRAWTTSGNRFAALDPFVRAVPQQGLTAIADFALQAGAPVVDAGHDYATAEPAVPLDAALRCRPAHGANATGIAHYDVGAFEANGGTACLAGGTAPPPSPPPPPPDGSGEFAGWLDLVVLAADGSADIAEYTETYATGALATDVTQIQSTQALVESLLPGGITTAERRQLVAAAATLSTGLASVTTVAGNLGPRLDALRWSIDLLAAWADEALATAPAGAPTAAEFDALVAEAEAMRAHLAAARAACNAVVAALPVTYVAPASSFLATLESHETALQAARAQLYAAVNRAATVRTRAEALRN